MTQLVLIRHGESQWNLENKFTGWIDIPLSKGGEEEARKAGEKLKGMKFDVIFISVLKRAIQTYEIAAEILPELKSLPVFYDKALNERMYGDLQGLNKDETRKKFGAEQVQLWRRSYDVAPPNGESLKDTSDRVMPYYHEKMEPYLKEGKNVLVFAHGNSLRALVMHLDNLSKEEVVKLEIPTGVPILYEFDKDLKVINKKEL
jgi:2,3-bisphosphoglycerate-dependent phosphoglycerate mutase